MTKPEIILVVARADNGVIGKEGRIPWKLPADMKHFRQVTMGTPMIMGRKTFESLPGLLEGRRHIVLSRDTHWSAPGAEVTRSIEEAINLANSPRISVIGGAEIYALFTPCATRFELTEVHCNARGDTSMPPPDPAIWQEVSREQHEAEDDHPAYSFVRLERRSS
jgi:dihydrofolate reductase